MPDERKFDQRNQKEIGPQINVAGDATLPPPPLALTPHLRSPPKDFTGRDKEISELLARFEQGVTIIGMGGIGKTALVNVLANPTKIAWQDLHRRMGDEDSDIRWRAAQALGKAFSQVPDKLQAWQDLHRLTQDKKSYVRQSAALALGEVFSQAPDKSQAWQDLHKLARDVYSYVRRAATVALGSAFSQVPDKTLAWEDLHRLAGDKDRNVRRAAAVALGSAFSYVPDKALAWQDLHRLVGDKNRNVRRAAAVALGSAFSQVPDKILAWQDLHRLVGDKNRNVRRAAAVALGSAFSQVPDKTLAWQDLHRLAGDRASNVRMYAYHSLGRAAIFKATETANKDTMNKELEAAIAFFEKSSQEYAYGPARFCCPFYRSYFAITFQEAEEDEVQRYLAEAKEAVGGSESKDELLGAVENLAQALQESQRLKGRSLEEIASELNAYRLYCEKAASYMDAAEDKASVAVKLMRMGNPFLEEQIQATIAEIQQKARQICQITRGSGTVYEAPVTEINKAARTISLDDICRTERSLSRITSQLKEICSLLPRGKRERVCDALEEVEKAVEFPDKLDKIELAIAYVGPAVEIALQSGDLSQDIKKIDNKVDQVLTKVIVVDGKLDEIRYHIFKIRISSGNVISNLISLREELEKIHQLSEQHPESSLRELFSCQEDQLDELGKDLEDRFAELNGILKEKASKNDIRKIEQIKPAVTWRSKIWDKADKGATLLTYITFITESIAILSTVI